MHARKKCARLVTFGGIDTATPTPPKKITARTIRIDFYGKFGRFLKVVKLFSVKNLDSLVKEDHTFLSKKCQ